jgi:hypothetical protein
MPASALYELLDARKSVRSRKELEDLAEQYSIDVPTLEKLAKVVNTPSIGEQSTVRSVEDGEERILSKVREKVLSAKAPVTSDSSSFRRYGPIHRFLREIIIVGGYTNIKIIVESM